MKKYMIAAIFAGLTSVTFAQGYVGAIRSLTNVGFDCPANLTCDKSSKGWKFYAGSKLPSSIALDAGFVKVESFEVAYMRFGKATLKGGAKTIKVYDIDEEALGNDPFPTHQVPVTHSAEADALALAFVARAPIFDQFAISARLGVAYVSSTYRTFVDGKTDSSQTKTKVKPYVGLGFEYDIPSIVKLVGTVDMTKYNVAGYSGSLRMVGLGAEKSF